MSGPVAVRVSAQIAQPHPQWLLDDLEAGLPFPFVDEPGFLLAVPAPSAPGAARDAGRMQATLTASAPWREAP